MLQASLRVVGGKHDGESIPMSSHRFLIGREEDCQLRPNNDLVSRHHCAFTIDGYSVRLRDLGSTNGTLVNGSRLRGETTLKTGDRVSIGKLEFELEIGAAEPTESSPAATTSPLLQGETAELSSEETTYDLPAVPAGGDTTVINSADAPAEVPAEVPDAEVAPVAAEAAQQPAAAAAVPPGQQPPQAQPGYYPQQPVAYPQQQMGYPPQPGYYVQQPMGYPQPPAYFPPQYGYPPQAMPGQPIPAQFQPPVEAPAPEPQATEADSIPDVRLPDPTQTGAGDASSDSAGNAGQSSDEEKNPSDHAADIIRQHMNRRPVADD